VTTAMPGQPPAQASTRHRVVDAAGIRASCPSIATSTGLTTRSRATNEHSTTTPAAIRSTTRSRGCRPMDMVGGRGPAGWVVG